MRRILLALFAVALLGATGTATADFHLPTQACANAPGEAHVSLTHTGGWLTFKGEVTCPGATYAVISSLILTPVVPAGPAVSGSTASCGPCSATPIVATGAVPATIGVFRVEMIFSALGPGGSYNNLQRAQQYLWVTGDPIAL